MKVLQKQRDAEAMAKKVIADAQAEEAEKLAKKKKNRDHILAMKEHSTIPNNNYLAKTGVAIIRNQGD